jgi:hypothetical protein
MITALNAETIYSKLKKPATVRLTPNGFIRFSSDAVKQLNLKEFDTIEFFLDSEKRDVVFFCISPKGIPLRQCNRNKVSPSMQICCRPLPLKLLTHLNLKEAITIRLYAETVLHNGHKCWVIDKFNKHIPTKWK